MNYGNKKVLKFEVKWQYGIMINFYINLNNQESVNF